MSRRIFTKVFQGCVMATTDVLEYVDAKEAHLVQEDIEVIGAEATAYSTLPSENDGWAFIEVELSQVGRVHKDGAILAVSSSEGWNTTPAGITRANGHVAIAFPSGLAIPVKEEGYLYINTVSTGKSAGTSMFNYWIAVHYIKKSVR